MLGSAGQVRPAKTPQCLVQSKPSTVDNYKPLISIITPVLNQAALLERALRSVADAAAKAPVETVEHIVIDGGSADGTPELLVDHKAPAFRWLSEPDQGQSDAINKGLAMAHGTYAGWLNADDTYEPNALAIAAKALQEYPDVDILIGRCKFVDERGKVVHEPVPPDPLNVANLLRLKSQWFAGRSIAQPEVFFRLSLFQELGGLTIENHHSMDYELWLKFVAAGAKVLITDMHLANLSVHPQQKTADNRQVVRSILGVARPCVDTHMSELGSDAEAVIAELDSMAAKLKTADAAIDRWQRARTSRSQEVRADAGAVEAYFDHAAQYDDRWRQPMRRIAARRTQDGLRLAKRHLRGKKRLRVLEIGSAAGDMLCHVIDRFGLRELELVACHPSLAMLEMAQRRVDADLDSSRHTLELVQSQCKSEALSEQEPFDLVVSHTALVHAFDPASAAAEIWSLLAPGGLWVRAAEVYPVPTLEPYLDWLIKMLSNNLSTNDEVRLHPDADSLIGRIETEQSWTQSPERDLWLEAFPGWAGSGDVDGPFDLERAQVLRNWRFGSLDFHPLIGLPFVGPPKLAADAWNTSLLLKQI